MLVICMKLAADNWLLHEATTDKELIFLEVHRNQYPTSTDAIKSQSIKFHVALTRLQNFIDRTIGSDKEIL